MKKSVVLIDAGYLKQAVKKLGYFPDRKTITQIATNCCQTEEELHKILYYDCKPFKPLNNSKYINPTTQQALKEQDNTLMKYARKFNIQIVLIQLEYNHLSVELKTHADFCRKIDLLGLKLTKYNASKIKR